MSIIVNIYAIGLAAHWLDHPPVNHVHREGTTSYRHDAWRCKDGGKGAGGDDFSMMQIITLFDHGGHHHRKAAMGPHSLN